MKSILKIVAIVLLTGTSIKSKAQTCAGTLAELSLKNISITETTLEYDVYLKNTGTTSEIRLSAFGGNVVYTSGFLGTGTATLTVVQQPSACDFPTLGNIAPTHTASSQQMRYTQTIQNLASGNTVIMPVGTEMKLCRFRLTNSVPFDTASMSSVTLRLPNGEDAVSITRNIGVVYCDGNTNSSNFAGTLGTLTVGGPYVVDLTTLANSSFEKNSLAIVPNPVTDFATISYADTIEKCVVFNVMGQEILRKEVNATVSNIDFNDLPSGNYILNVYVRGGGFKSSQLIKK